jgi:serine/threonine protein phosphatase 1
MNPRTLAIGDIHGCSVALRTLLAVVELQPQDRVVTLGDYVDRGPDSRGVLDQLVALIHRCDFIPLIGNHDLMLLQSFHDPAIMEFWRSCGGNRTLASYDGSLENIPTEHLAFLRNLRPYFETEKWIFVHANYDAELPLAETEEDLLLWQHVSTPAPGPHFSGKRVIVGHTPQGDGRVLDLGHLVCIDTYCFGGGWLTAFDVETGEVWQADQQGNARHA